MSPAPLIHIVAGPHPGYDRVFCADCYKVVERYRDHANTASLGFTADEVAAMPTRRFDVCSGCDRWLVSPKKRRVP